MVSTSIALRPAVLTVSEHKVLRLVRSINPDLVLHKLKQYVHSNLCVNHPHLLHRIAFEVMDHERL